VAPCWRAFARANIDPPVEVIVNRDRDWRRGERGFSAGRLVTCAVPEDAYDCPHISQSARPPLRPCQIAHAVLRSAGWRP